ncbi:MAG: cyclopropane-fatty-acyl-phospholipid synthase [Proteobacteria bacterium]|nr:cyclopropane-fatty-acyl-phospholipid synthase [Pseudomonadota bacterium]
MFFNPTTLIGLTERGMIPDPLLRFGIRNLLRQRLASLPMKDCETAADYTDDFIRQMNQAPMAVVPEKANEQHYEVPEAFFGLVLGQHRKYSSCHWAEGASNLDDAEAAALKTTCERACLKNGQDILELGCGWGSLTLWMAGQYPESRITAVSNSHSQRTYLLAEAERRGLQNVEVITCDMNQFNADKHFDRVVSVEMFEHMRNWRELFHKIHGWLKPGGLFFMHIFVHRALPYLFTVEDESDWMSQHFFSGGMMPSDDLPFYFQDSLTLVRNWRWNGRHYEKTANAWLANMDNNKEKVWPILAETYGAESAQTWWVRWRLFFMACAELWGYDKGQQWWVGHYLFENSGRPESHPTIIDNAA